MTPSQQIITIGTIVLGTVLTRFLLFLLSPTGKPTLKYMQYLRAYCPSQSLHGSLSIV